MKYCLNCVIPDTRPQIVLDRSGICNACRSSAKKQNIDWVERERQFRELVNFAKAQRRAYDCVIPVSGGKDSTWQVVKCLEYGLRPLAVTWRAPKRTEIGWRNLQNLIDLGVDHIDFQINPKVEKKFLYQALIRFGSTAIPMHMALFNIPLMMALKFDVALVVWGENSALEYGGTDDAAKSFRLDEAWLKTYGVTHGTTAADWVSPELTREELTPYVGPTDDDLRGKNIQVIFLGCYFPWDPEISLKVAQENGFQVRSEGPKTGYYNYADIDDDFISIHHYLKWYKFGITRLFDNLSIEIRNGRMTREKAIEIIRQEGDQTPQADIESFCEFVGITKQHFFSVIEKFRNQDIWKQNNGTWAIENFIIPNWRWHENCTQKTAA